MAIINNNVQNIQFLRNQTPYESRAAALQALEDNKGLAIDGSSLLARYTDSGVVKTLVGYVYVNGATHDITIFDIDGASSDVNELRQEILDILGNGVSSANTVTAQLTALSGDSSTDTSATTSVEGAKKYANDLIGTLDYTGVTTGDGVYITNVIQADGVVSATAATLPSSADTAEAKKFVIAVAEDKGQIEVSRGSIASSGKTIVLSDTADGGVNFEANVDGTTIIVDENTGVMSVASSALVQYEGDDDTVQISAVQDGVRTVSSPLTIQKVTTGLSEEVKEEYHLVGASETTIGDPVKIYKDSHIVSINYITDSASTYYQNLEYVYIDASGNTQTTHVDMSELVLEAEFASGVTITDHIAHGVVDPTSEAFLTVGADGFKLSGVQNAIDAAVSGTVEDLDATVTGATSGNHITISIEELDGKLVQSGLTIEENDIASAAALAELSGKTITAITSNNASITATIDDAVGNKSYNIETDASKIKMSGFTSTDVLSGISEDDSVVDAIEEIDSVITANEEVTAAALNDLRTDIDTVSGKVESMDANFISGVTMNGSAITASDHVVPLVINSTSATTAASNGEAIIVTTNNDGSVTLNLATLDCGTYA
jgi:hypothetical protein